jgi:formylglycine-generating enzyme required for sulfatase activity
MDRSTERSLGFFILFVLALAVIPVLAATCPSCKSQNPDDVEFCETCGERLVKKAPIPAPRVVGMEKDAAISLLKSKGFAPRVVDSVSDGVPGRVLRQSRATLWVSVAFPEPKWLRKIRDVSGWPAQGRAVAGVPVGESLSTVRNVLGEPVMDSAGSWYYRRGEDSIRVVFKLGASGATVDTICVSMSAALRQALATPFSYILKALAAKEPEESDSLHKAYPKDGITLFYHSDTTIVGFSIYAPLKQAPWVSALKKNWLALLDPSPSILLRLPQGTIKRLLGPPTREETTALVYEDNGSTLTFSIVGGELDTVVLHLVSPLRELLPGLKTTQAAESTYRMPASRRSIGVSEELSYPDSGLSLVYESGHLSSVNKYWPEYYQMVFIPSGRFLLGTALADRVGLAGDYRNEMPQNEVFLDSFYIDKYEVTNRQFRQFLRATGYRMRGDSSKIVVSGADNHPVVGVSWNDANAYARWAKKRLPTEIEWEKAARCTASAWRFPWGSGISEADVASRANYRSTQSARGTTVPVNSLDKGTSLYGVYNMAGNVMEWCATAYSPDYYKTMPKTVSNPRGPEGLKSDSLATVRGGSYNSPLFEIRTSYRRGLSKNQSREDVGFRCVKDVRVMKEEK